MTESPDAPHEWSVSRAACGSLHLILSAFLTRSFSRVSRPLQIEDVYMLDVIPNFVDGPNRIEGTGELQRDRAVSNLLGNFKDVLRHCLEFQSTPTLHVLDVSDTTIHSYRGGEALCGLTFGLTAPWRGRDSLKSASYERFWDALCEAGMPPRLATTSVEVCMWGRTVCAIAVSRADAEAFLAHGSPDIA